jgi:hypothetical protein
LLNVLQVLFPNFAENEDGVQIYDRKRIGECSQNIGHKSHEICWNISQTKRNDPPFKNNIFILEGSIPNISLFDWNLDL